MPTRAEMAALVERLQQRVEYWTISPDSHYTGNATVPIAELGRIRQCMDAAADALEALMQERAAFEVHVDHKTLASTSHEAIGAPPLMQERAEPMQEWRDDELAASPTPKVQTGTWTLTAPDGRTWQADTPLRCAAAEANDRVPPDVQLARIARSIADAPQEPAQPVAQDIGKLYGVATLLSSFGAVETAKEITALADRMSAPPSHPAPSEAGAERQERDRE